MIPSAAAAGALTITPTTTSVTAVNLAAPMALSDVANHYSLVQPLSNATFATRVTSTVSALNLQFETYTAPTGVTTSNPFLYYSEATTGGTAGPTAVADGVDGGSLPDDGPWRQLDADNVTPPMVTLAGSSSVATKDVFFAADVPGTYKFHFTDPGVQAGTDDDMVSPTITMTVLDAQGATAAGGTTSAATDDWAPTISNSVTTAGVGAPFVGTVSLSGLTLADARGSSAGVGVLNGAIKNLVGIAFSGAGAAGAETVQAAVAAAGTRSLPAGETTVDGTLTSTAVFDYDGAGLTATTRALGTATTTISGNGVTAVALDATDVTGSVKEAAGAVKVKTGTAAVTYTATVTDADLDKSGNLVYFTLGGADAATLTTNGTTVDSAAHIFSKTTDTSGVATLVVTSSKTTAATTYTVDSSSNAHPSATLTATYADAAATTIESDNTAADLTPTAAAGVSVTLKGKLVDQFGGAFTPASSGVQTVTVTVPGGVTIVCNSVITGGNFSCVYTPTVTPVAGTSTTYRFAYTGVGTPYDGTINWASTTAAATLTLTTPSATVARANLSNHTTISPGQSTALTGSTAAVEADDFGSATGEVTGTVYDASSAPLAFKTVTLTGGDGVYFSSSATPGASASDDLATTMTVVTNASGVFGGGYAFFTKSGTVKVTATAGAATDFASVVTDDSSDSYKITVNDVSGTPGGTLIITGTIKDAFENPVPNQYASLSIGTSTLGAFGNSTPITNAAGVFSTTFTSGSNQSGEADLTATILGQSANEVAVAGWLTNAGLTIPHGEYMDTATLSLTEIKLTLAATAKLMGGGKAKLSGSFTPSTGVDIYAKASGATSFTLLDSVETDAEGDFGAAYSIKKTTAFLAKSAGLSSKVVTTKVYSTVSLTAKSYTKGHATLSANGSPSAKGTLTFSRSVAGKDPILKSMTSNTSGNGKVTVKLPKGTRSVYVSFKAPGTAAGTSKTVKVTVK